MLSIQQNTQQSARGRLGVRLSYQDQFSLVTNLWQDLTPTNEVSIGTESYREKQARTWLELGVATQLYTSKHFSVYADLRTSHSLRGLKRTSYEGKIGMQVNW